jgi:hypothetical protein
MGWIRALILLCAWTGIVAAQVVVVRQRTEAPQQSGTLQLGTPIERTIGPGQTHSYQVSAEENSLVQITVEQRGVDVVVRVHLGKRVAEYDTPNGSDGPENVSFVTSSKEPYRIDVTPLNYEGATTGRYEIRLVELRKATDQEITESRGQEALKARGLALLAEIEGVITELRLPQSRIKAQIQTAQLLWDADEKRALKYVTDAVTGFRELQSNMDLASREYTRNYHVVNNLRYEIVQVLTRRQPEMALSFIRSTQSLPDPYGNQRDVSAYEAQMELEVANRIVEKDPKRALEIARENLKSRYSSALINTVYNLRPQNPEAATELANEIASKLLRDKLLKSPEASSLAMSLIQMSAPPPVQPVSDANTSGSARRFVLLSEQTRRELLQKAISEALEYKATAIYSPQRDYAWSMLNGLRSMGAEVDSVSNGSAAIIDKRIKEFPGYNAPPSETMMEYTNAINNPNMPLDEVIQVLSKAPKEQRDQLYINLSNRAHNSGDAARAKQIINDYVTTPYQRQQALYNLEMQEVQRAMGKGKIEDALRSIGNISNPQERAQALAQMANQIGPGYKRASALLFLEQARNLLSPSQQAQDATHMQALFEIAKAYSRYDSKRAFEIVDPLVDQFNDISGAARTLEGFGGEFYEQEELNMYNGNAIATAATNLTSTLGTLAVTNFDRAKLTADRIRLPEVRLRAYLDIAQQAIQNQR